jgi:DNA recombination protein RmuC
MSATWITIISVAILITLSAFALKVFLNSFLEKVKTSFKEEKEGIVEKLDAKKDLIDERLKSEERSFDQKKEHIKELVDRIGKELSESQKKLQEAEKERIGEFNSLKSVLDEHKNVTADLKDSTDYLKNILSNNQLRGRYGEEVAENLLKTAGFVKGQSYIANEAQDTKSSRPDFTILLPDKTKVNVDVKFPLNNLLKFQETENKEEKKKFLKDFGRDVKNRVNEVAGRDYINPEDNTVDFVILFVPNEMIFSFIYDQLNEVWDEAMKKKVVLAGPFSFVAILRMIFQSYKNFKYQENLQEIIKLIKVFEKEYIKYNDELDTLGKRIQSVSSQYDVVSSTRTRKLSGVVEKIKGESDFSGEKDLIK